MTTSARAPVQTQGAAPAVVETAAARRRWSPQTLRSRVTVVVVAGTSVLLAIALGRLYLALSAELHSAVDNGLRARLEDLSTTARSDLSQPIADPYAQVVTPNGHVVATSRAAPDTCRD